MSTPIDTTGRPERNAAADRSRRREDGLPADLRNADLAGRDLSGLDLIGRDLSGANLSGAVLRDARLFKANLRGASLRRADLRGAECTGADFTGAHMEELRGDGVGLGMARLAGAELFGARLAGATLSRADLTGADLRTARLSRARIREAVLVGADLTAADLEKADLALCNVAGATFDNANMREARLRAVRRFQKARWYGVDTHEINFAGAYRIRRHIIDENYLKEFRESGPWHRTLYCLWRLTSNCGRSAGLWMAWVIAIAGAFGLLYRFVDVHLGPDPGWVSPWYFSVVTLTTLGYGDIYPVSTVARLVTMAEVAVGYVMLGGLLSIFANKIARRGD